MSDGPAYPPARAVAAGLCAHFARLIENARARGKQNLASGPLEAEVESIIDAAFWASLRREEGYSPKISLALVAPDWAGHPLLFGRALPLGAHSLAKLAPAVERPGIHLGVWRDAGGGLQVWGTTRTIPSFSFVLEVIEPGLLVVKYRRAQGTGKYVNVLVLKGDQVKEVDERGANLPDCPDLVTALLGFGSPAVSSAPDSVNLLVQLAASMRAHGRGGALLVVPHGTSRWRESIVQPMAYETSPPYTELAELMRRDASERKETAWQEALIDAVEAVAGLTAVDGAALITDQYELLSFGAKIARREGAQRVEQVMVTEPVVGGTATTMHPSHLGGTRHLSAAQFVEDQRDAVALVASQDGRFTVFAWSPCEGLVHAHRVESLLL